MVNEYLVIKDFGIATVGDVFVKDPDVDAYIMIADTYEDNLDASGFKYTATRRMYINSAEIQSLHARGFIEEISKPIDVNAEKLTKIEALIKELLPKYEAMIDTLIESYENGSIPECVKVEGETVYYNLIKLLKTIQTIVGKENE